MYCHHDATICSNMPSHIPGGGGPDQAALNLLMSMHPYKDVTYYATSQDAWAAQLGTTADPKKIELYRQHLTDSEPVFEDGIVKNKDGVPYYIVHQYDRILFLKNQIEKLYGDDDAKPGTIFHHSV